MSLNTGTGSKDSSPPQRNAHICGVTQVVLAILKAFCFSLSPNGIGDLNKGHGLPVMLCCNCVSLGRTDALIYLPNWWFPLTDMCIDCDVESFNGTSEALKRLVWLAYRCRLLTILMCAFNPVNILISILLGWNPIFSIQMNVDKHSSSQDKRHSAPYCDTLILVREMYRQCGRK